MRVAIIENMAGTPYGQVGIALSEASAEIEVFRPWMGEALPAGTESHDAVVVLGGEQNAIDDENYPYLPELAELMRRFGDADKPVLGICLGGQLLARAYGGENRLKVAREFGWEKVEITQEGKQDPLLASLGNDFRVFEWHFDTFSLPEGAIRLATNATTANQAFKIGRASYGVQFHFEANRGVVEGWRQNFSSSIDKIAPGWLDSYEHSAATYGPAADDAGLAIARAWVGLVQTAAGANRQPAALCEADAG